MMMFDEGADGNIRCGFASKWFKVDSYVFNTEGIISEIEKLKPDAVILDMNLFDKIDGIETSSKIRSHCRYSSPAWPSRRCW